MAGCTNGDRVDEVRVGHVRQVEALLMSRVSEMMEIAWFYGLVLSLSFRALQRKLPTLHFLLGFLHRDRAWVCAPKGTYYRLGNSLHGGALRPDYQFRAASVPRREKWKARRRSARSKRRRLAAANTEFAPFGVYCTTYQFFFKSRCSQMNERSSLLAPTNVHSPTSATRSFQPLDKT